MQDASDTRVSGEEGLNRTFGSVMSWNIAEMAVSQSIALGVIIFLEWRLGLRVFGLFALSVVFIDLLHQQGRSASVDALMQGRDFSAAKLSSALFSMLAVLMIAIPFLGLYGYVIAEQNNEPILKWMVPALALTLLPLPFGVAPMAILNHALDFKGIAIRGILAAAMGGIAAIFVAFSAYPEWALVAQRAVSILASVMFLMVRARWLPNLTLDFTRAGRFLKDASRIFFAQGLAASVIPALYLVVGSFFGTAAVGALRIASKFSEMIYGAIAAPMGSLWVILQTRHDLGARERKDLYVGLSKMAAMICLPVFAGGALVAEDLVALVLSSESEQVGSLLLVFCLIGLLSPFFYFRNHAFTALGKLNWLIGFAVVDISVTVLASLGAAYFGLSLEAVIGTLAVHFIVTILLFTRPLLTAMATRLIDVIKAVTPGYVGVLAMSLVVYIVSSWVADSPVALRLIAKISAGAGVYGLFLFGFHRHWFFAAIEMLRPGQVSHAGAAA